jgi:hypothetical protein
MNLGIVYDSQNNMINHRSLVKVVLNPLLRVFGCQIATMCEREEDGKLTLGHPTFTRCDVVPLWKGLRQMKYELRPGDYIVRRRLFL